MAELISYCVIFFVIYFVGWLFLYLPIMGFIYIFSAEYSTGMLYLLPLFGLYCVLLYRVYVILPERRRQELLREKFNYPSSLDDKENADQWHIVFFNVINDKIANTTEDKQEDLKRCQQVVKRMATSNAFNKFHKAFRLTGCHMEIKDPSGQTIAKIV